MVHEAVLVVADPKSGNSERRQEGVCPVAVGRLTRMVPAICCSKPDWLADCTPVLWWRFQSVAREFCEIGDVKLKKMRGNAPITKPRSRHCIVRARMRS